MTRDAAMHLRFVGGTIRCPEESTRRNLGPDHEYGAAFDCPGCGQHVEATDHYKAESQAPSKCPDCKGLGWFVPCQMRHTVTCLTCGGSGKAKP